MTARTHTPKTQVSISDQFTSQIDADCRRIGREKLKNQQNSGCMTIRIDVPWHSSESITRMLENCELKEKPNHFLSRFINCLAIQIVPNFSLTPLTMMTIEVRRYCEWNSGKQQNSHLRLLGAEQTNKREKKTQKKEEKKWKTLPSMIRLKSKESVELCTVATTVTVTLRFLQAENIPSDFSFFSSSFYHRRRRRRRCHRFFFFYFPSTFCVLIAGARVFLLLLLLYRSLHFGNDFLYNRR